MSILKYSFQLLYRKFSIKKKHVTVRNMVDSAIRKNHTIENE